MQKLNANIRPIFTVFLISIFFLTLATFSYAGSKPQPIEGMSYDVNTTIADNLKTLVGKKVSVTLDSGNVLSGTLKTVGSKSIHLEKLDQKNFFDALIRLENIIAVSAQFRKY
ncbi:MAG: hypothetical protein GY729_07095 [Desulfobacteraceae bacterium]|nr:hypothetical protein [Desulfobacteraceae bacterium]